MRFMISQNLCVGHQQRSCECKIGRCDLHTHLLIDATLPTSQLKRSHIILWWSELQETLLGSNFGLLVLRHIRFYSSNWDHKHP